MKTFCRYWTLLLACMILNVANAQSEKASKVVQRMKEEATAPLVLQDYTNGTESAVAFLGQIDSLQAEKSRMKVVRFSAALVRKSKRQKGQQNTRDVDTFVSQMVSLIDADPSGRVRSEAAQSLRKVVSPELIDSHHSSILKAYERHKDVETLLLYASLPSCHKTTLAKMARGVQPEGKRDSYKLSAILAKCGDHSATDTLIAEAENVSEISDVNLSELLSALAFVRTDRVKRFLAKGLRSEGYVSLPGGSKIPRRNCFAHALVQMNMHNEEFPVKDADYIFSDDDLDKIEQWCADELDVGSPRAPRKELSIIPSFEPVSE